MRLGVQENIRVKAPLGGEPEDANDREVCVLHHFRGLISCVQQQLRYVIVSQAPPMCYVRLAKYPNDMEHMRRLSEFMETLHTSNLPGVRKVSLALTFLKWATVREPVQLCDRGHFVPESEHCKRAREYIRAGVSQSWNSFMNENIIGGLRDNERKAKHMQRSNGVLQALCISNVTQRYRENPKGETRLKCPEITEEDVSRCKEMHIAPGIMEAKSAPVAESVLGFRAVGSGN